MSKLTNCQIRARIYGLQASLSAAAARGDVNRARSLSRRIEDYTAELAERQASGLNPGTEIQAVRFGARKGRI
jgi:hypothetical protein